MSSVANPVRSRSTGTGVAERQSKFSEHLDVGGNGALG
jgi:hypothetical protein